MKPFSAYSMIATVFLLVTSNATFCMLEDHRLAAGALGKLPPELTQKIIAYLPAVDCKHLKETCSYLHDQTTQLGHLGKLDSATLNQITPYLSVSDCSNLQKSCSYLYNRVQLANATDFEIFKPLLVERKKAWCQSLTTQRSEALRMMNPDDIWPKYIGLGIVAFLTPPMLKLEISIINRAIRFSGLQYWKNPISLNFFILLLKIAKFPLYSTLHIGATAALAVPFFLFCFDMAKGIPTLYRHARNRRTTMLNQARLADISAADYASTQEPNRNFLGTTLTYKEYSLGNVLRVTQRQPISFPKKAVAFLSESPFVCWHHMASFFEKRLIGNALPAVSKIPIRPEELIRVDE